MTMNGKMMAGVLCLLTVQTVGAEDIPLTRTVTVANEPVARVRAAGRTRFFCERQPYVPALNYQHKYIDRPLFTDTSLRKLPGGYSKPAFRRDIDILLWSGFEAFGSIAYPQWFYDQMNSYEKEPPPEGYSQFPIIGGFYRKPKGRDEAHYQTLKGMILAACRSQYATRFNGVPLVWMWNPGVCQQEAWVKLLKSDPEIPPFLCIPVSPFLPMYGSFNDPKHPGTCTPEACERYKRELADMLTWADGVQLRLHENYPSWNGDHGNHILKTDLCRKYLFPLTREVMARPEFRGKYLGAQIEQAYINHFNGPVTGQYGTETLRTFLDEAMLLPPDFFVGFEWNECNENTSFQPTVSGAGTIARVIGYYKAKLNGEVLRPRPGDDVTVPNLVLSTRQAMHLGENYHVELLYIPDGVAAEPFRARVVLYAADGRKLREFPWEELPTERLTAFDYRLPSEAFARELAVYPEVEVTRGGAVRVFSGFNCTRFDPTTCINYLYSRQPFRELLEPQKAEFAVTPAADGAYRLSGAFACTNALSSLEALEDLREAVSVDRERIFDRTKYELFRLSVLPIRDLPTGGDATVEVTGCDDWKIWKSYLPYDGAQRILDGANPRHLKINVCSRRVLFLAVPKATAATARVKVCLGKIGAAPEIDLGTVLGRGIQARTWPQQVRLEVERMDFLPDYPVPLEATSAAFDETLRASAPFPVYQMRAIAKDGRIWRSKPVVPRLPSAETRTIRLYSEYRRTMTNAAPQCARIVDVSYDFADRSRGDILCAGGDNRRWDVLLGGGWEASGPMNWAWNKKKLTADFTNSVPDRVVTEEGTPALRFDGRGQYLALPQEAIPADSTYEISFEIRPADAESRVLIRQSHSVRTEAGLRLVSDRGELVLSFFGRSLVPRHFRTGLKLRPGEWNRVTVEKTGVTLSCALEGIKKTYPYDRRATLFQTAIFGANVMPGDQLPEGIRPFKGEMRALQIRHGTDIP